MHLRKEELVRSKLREVGSSVTNKKALYAKLYGFIPTIKLTDGLKAPAIINK